MFHPVGSQSTSVYWRRRFVLSGVVVLLIVLLALTVHAVMGGGGSSPAGAGAMSPASRTSSPPSSTAPMHTSTSPASTAGSSSAGGSAGKGVTSGSGSDPGPSAASTPPADCTSSQLSLSAIVEKTSYSVGQHPVVGLRVTNLAATPCVQDLASKQIVLKIYNGESRVWDSHDCQSEPGTDDRTLAAGQTVDITLQWTGTTSEPGCSGTRQQVGAGTYTLYATMSGHTGRAAQFTVS